MQATQQSDLADSADFAVTDEAEALLQMDEEAVAQAGADNQLDQAPNSFTTWSTQPNPISPNEFFRHRSGQLGSLAPASHAPANSGSSSNSLNTTTARRPDFTDSKHP